MTNIDDTALTATKHREVQSLIIAKSKLSYTVFYSNNIDLIRFRFTLINVILQRKLCMLVPSQIRSHINENKNNTRRHSIYGYNRECTFLLFQSYVHILRKCIKICCFRLFLRDSMEIGPLAHRFHNDHRSPLHKNCILTHFLIHSLHTMGNFCFTAAN